MLSLFSKAKNISLKVQKNVEMVKVQIELGAEEYAQLVRIAIERYGKKRGSLSKLLKEAVERIIKEGVEGE